MVKVKASGEIQFTNSKGFNHPMVKVKDCAIDNNIAPYPFQPPYGES